MQNKVSNKQWKRQGKEVPGLNCKGHKKELHSHVDRKPPSVYTRIILVRNKKFLSNLLYWLSGLLLLGSHWGARQPETLIANASFSSQSWQHYWVLPWISLCPILSFPTTNFSPQESVFIHLFKLWRSSEWSSLLSLHTFFRKKCSYNH